MIAEFLFGGRLHAQNDHNPEIHQRVAPSGAWGEFDGVGPTSINLHVDLVSNMRRAGLVERVIVSHDAGWYSVGEPRGGEVRGCHKLFTEFLPALKKAGFDEVEIVQLRITNPVKVFTINVRAI